MMRVLTLDEIIVLKKMLFEESDCSIHLHDVCGGQYFSAEKLDDGAKKLIARFLDSKGLLPAYTKDNDGFRVLENK